MTSKQTSGYKNKETELTAEHLFAHTELSATAIDRAVYWLGQDYSPRERAFFCAEELEVIVENHIDGLLRGNSLMAQLLRTALSRVDWKALAYQCLAFATEAGNEEEDGQEE